PPATWPVTSVTASSGSTWSRPDRWAPWPRAASPASPNWPSTGPNVPPWAGTSTTPNPRPRPSWLCCRTGFPPPPARSSTSTVVSTPPEPEGTHRGATWVPPRSDPGTLDPFEPHSRKEGAHGSGTVRGTSPGHRGQQRNRPGHRPGVCRGGRVPGPVCPWGRGFGDRERGTHGDRSNGRGATARCHRPRRAADLRRRGRPGPGWAGRVDLQCLRWWCTHPRPVAAWFRHRHHALRAPDPGRATVPGGLRKGRFGGVDL